MFLLSRPAPRLALACLLLPLLTACGPEISGTPTPPPEFGARESALVGCPKMEGLYAWPPVEGEYANGFASNRRPWDSGRPIMVYKNKMQIKVEHGSGRVTIRSRSIGPRSLPSAQARDWGYIEYGVAQFSCKDNMLHFEELDYHDPKNYGGNGARRGFTLARMKDGSLAVGIKTTSTGRGGSYFSWGGQSYGSYNAADKVYWSWSKLQGLDATKD